MVRASFSETPSMVHDGIATVLFRINPTCAES